MKLAAKPRNRITPFILDVFDTEQPEGSPRVYARQDTRTGEIWRTSAKGPRPTMAEIRAALKPGTAQVSA